MPQRQTYLKIVFECRFEKDFDGCRFKFFGTNWITVRVAHAHHIDVFCKYKIKHMRTRLDRSLLYFFRTHLTKVSLAGIFTTEDFANTVLNER